MIAGQQMQRRNRQMGGVGNHLAKLAERPIQIDSGMVSTKNNDINPDPQVDY
jgi:hypothetical protein